MGCTGFLRCLETQAGGTQQKLVGLSHLRCLQSLGTAGLSNFEPLQQLAALCTCWRAGMGAAFKGPPATVLQPKTLTDKTSGLRSLSDHLVWIFTLFKGHAAFVMQPSGINASHDLVQLKCPSGCSMSASWRPCLFEKLILMGLHRAMAEVQRCSTQLL